MIYNVTTLYKVTTVSQYKPDVETVEYVFTKWTARNLELKIREQAPGLKVVTVAPAPPETQAQTPLLESGDIVTVQDGKYRGCILDLLAVTKYGAFVLRNTYGDYDPIYGCPVIRVRAVSFLRKPPTRIEAY